MFGLQSVRPDPLEQVAERGDEGVLLDAHQRTFAVAKLHRLAAHLLHQHALGAGLALLGVGGGG